jgi:hypothetical protein
MTCKSRHCLARFSRKFSGFLLLQQGRIAAFWHRFQSGGRRQGRTTVRNVWACFPRQKVGTILGAVSYFSLAGNCIAATNMYFLEAK